MMGAAGALCCLLAGTAAGSWLRDRRLRRLRTLRARLDVVASLRLMLEQERMGLTELLCQCAHYAPTGPGGEQVSRRLLWVAHALVQEPLLSLGDAYAQACAQIPIPWEKAEEREAMRALFLQLGSGTAAMRAQAAAACLRRLRPLEEDARREAEKGGGLVMRLGLLLGLRQASRCGSAKREAKRWSRLICSLSWRVWAWWWRFCARCSRARGVRS